ncbi:hypothetical protein WDU94_012815 [Cyamophila willieti]
MYNSLDAGAQSVAIRVELKSSFTLQVIDDGVGVDKIQLDLLGQRYMTSKCHSLADLSCNLSYYGYRGECLASLRETCEEIVIMSRAKGSKKTFMKVLKSTNYQTPCEELTMKRNCHGMTVIVKNFMCHYPVRQKNIKHHLELEYMKKQILDLCVMHPQISFTIRDDATKTVILQIKKHQTTRDQILFLIANTIKFQSSLIHVTMKHKDYFIDGYISREPISQPQYQNIYVNKRLITNTILHETVNKLLVKSFYLNITKDSNKLKPDGKSKCSVYFINITCPYTCYEMVSQPTKENRTFIEFTNWKRLFKAMEMFVDEFLKTEDFVNNISETVDEQKVVVEKEQVDHIEYFDKDIENNINSGKKTNEVDKKTNHCEYESPGFANQYSLKMVEHYQEHSRRSMKRGDIQDRGTVLGMIPNNEERQREEQYRKFDEKNKHVEEDEAFLRETNNDTECGAHEQTMNRPLHVKSLKQKIKQLKHENQRKKEKEKKKIKSSLHSKNNFSLRSSQKRSSNHRRQLDSDKVKKDLRNNIPRDRHNNEPEELGRVKRVKLARREREASICSKATEKKWNSSAVGRNKISNESIFTQPLPPKPKKKEKSQTRVDEPKKKELTTNESIFTGLDTYELVKNYKETEENMDDGNNVSEDVPKESCNFEQLFDICNLNLFRLFETDDDMVPSYTPQNLSHMELTPIKVKRKNIRQQKATKTTEQEDNIDIAQTAEESQSLKAQREDTVIPANVGNKTVHLKMTNFKRTNLDMRGSKNYNINLSDKRSSSCQKYQNQSSVLQSKGEYRDLYHHNPLVNGHFADDFRATTNCTTLRHDYHKRSLLQDDRKRANKSRIHVKYSVSKMDKRNSTLREFRKSNSRCKTNWKKPLHWDKLEKASDARMGLEPQRNNNMLQEHDANLVPYDDSSNSFKRLSSNSLERMSQDFGNTFDDLDDYVNDVLSRSYNSRLTVDSQNAQRSNSEWENNSRNSNIYEFLEKNSKHNMISILSTKCLISGTTETEHNFNVHFSEDMSIYPTNICMKSLDDIPKNNKMRVERILDIWEDNSKMENNRERSMSQTMVDIPERRPFQRSDQTKRTAIKPPVSHTLDLPKGQFFKSSCQQKLTNTIKSPDLNSHAVPFSPYFKHSNATENVVPRFSKPFQHQGTDENPTLMKHLADDGLKKFNLTPVLQSSNSNNELGAQCDISNGTTIHYQDHVSHRIGLDTTKVNIQGQGTALPKKLQRDFGGLSHLRKPRKDENQESETTETLNRNVHQSYSCYPNNHDHNHQTFRQDINRDHAAFFDEDTINVNDYYSFPSRIKQTCNYTSIQNSNRTISKENTKQLKKNRFSKQGFELETKNKERIELQDTQVLPLEGCELNLSNNEQWSGWSYHEENNTGTGRVQEITNNEVGYIDRTGNSHGNYEKTFDIEVDNRKEFDTEDEAIYEAYKNNIRQWFTPVEDNQFNENILETTREEMQDGAIEEVSQNKHNSLEFDDSKYPDKFDDTEYIFEKYRERNFTVADRRNESQYEDLQLSQEREHGIILQAETQSVHTHHQDETTTSGIRDVETTDNIPMAQNFSKKSLNKQLTTDCTHSKSDLTIGFEVNSKQADPKTVPNTMLEQADTIPITNNEATQNGRGETTKLNEIVEEKEIHEDTGNNMNTSQENLPMYKVTEIMDKPLVFNNLGLATDTEPDIAPNKGFQLKERYGFMVKGLSPLVLANNAATELGQLENCELEHIETILPSPLPIDNSEGNCIDKIVNMEEIVVRSNVKNSMMNTLCHVTKDLLDVTFKVIAQVDKKYILVLLNRTLLVAFDQHAVDERIRVEKLLTYYRNNADLSFIPHPISHVTLNLSRQDLDTLRARRDCVEYYGLRFELNQRYVKVTHLPKCLFVKLQKEANSNERLKATRISIADLIKEVVFTQTEIRGVIPASLIQVINMEACRGAIMFGKNLPLSTCYTLIKSLTRCKAPFQCAHGRPSVAPLADVKKITELISSRTA